MIAPGSPSEEGFCANCRYPLRGLPEPCCPECGQSFDPHDPHTFLVAGQRPMGPIARWLYQPPTLLFQASGVLSASFVLAAAVVPGWIRPLLHLGLICCFGISVFWLVGVLAYCVVGRFYRAPRTTWRAVRSWSFVPVLLVLAALLCRWRVPVLLGFLANKSAMNSLASQAAAGPQYRRLPDQKVGMYSATEILAVLGGFRFQVSMPHHPPGGFAYLPQGPPKGSREPRYERLWGNWYVWTRGMTAWEQEIDNLLRPFRPREL